MLWFTILVFFVGLWIYLGYPAMITAFVNGKKNTEGEILNELPLVEVIIPAYQEFKNIHHLLEDCQKQYYPADLVKITLVLDGPLPASFSNHLPSNVRVLHSLERKGKAHSLNKAVALSNAEIVLFLDANIRIEAHVVSKMVHAILEDPSITMAFGKKLVTDESSLVGSESIYWNYEHHVKMQEQNTNRLFAATGELIAMKRIHYCSLPEKIILDDLYQSINHIQKGGRLKYVPDAVSTEKASSNLLQEVRRKIRIGRGAAQLLAYVGWFPFATISFNIHFWHRKVARWVVFPLLLQVWIIFCIVFCFSSNSDFMIKALLAFAILLWLQLSKLRLPIFTSISRYVVYFPLVQLAVFWGFLSYYLGFRSNLWYKISR